MTIIILLRILLLLTLAEQLWCWPCFHGRNGSPFTRPKKSHHASSSSSHFVAAMALFLAASDDSTNNDDDGSHTSRPSDTQTTLFASSTTTTRNGTTRFPHDDGSSSSRRPYLALVTEPDACLTQDNLEHTWRALHQAVSTGLVDLISIRHDQVSKDADDVLARIIQLTRQLVDISDAHGFVVVVSSDWWSDVVTHVPTVHGVHVKESHRERLIPKLRRPQPQQPYLIGTSAHTVESAVDAWHRYQPDYFFVGTCYETQTHPEKTASDLEGPALPGQVASALQDVICDSQQNQDQQRRPPVLAIGGINSENCREPVTVYGADGVATIRAVLQADDPAQVVQSIKQYMMETNDV